MGTPAADGRRPDGRSVKRATGSGFVLELIVEPGRAKAHVLLARDETVPPACTEKDIVGFVNAAGLMLSDVEREALPRLAQRLVERGAGTFIAAEAIPPRAPATSIVWHVAYHETRLLPTEAETVDLREVSHFVNVQAGQLLCELIESAGIAGRDVFGEPIAPPRPDPKGMVTPGQLTTFDEERWAIVAASDGCMRVEKGVVSVIKLLEVKGDVDYEVGNIDFRGDVKIVGTVLPGFRVKATGNVLVMGMIEDAVVQADGDITVMGGVAGRHHGRLTAGGTIKARYVRAMEVHADRDVVVQSECIDALVRAGGQVQVGKGIIGGKIEAAGGIRSTFIGSEMAVPTWVGAGDSVVVLRQIFPNVTFQLKGRFQQRTASELPGPVTALADPASGGVQFAKR